LNEVENYTKYYNIRKGDIVVDAGAHVGVLTQMFSEAVGPDGLVLAVEPDFRALGMLTHNVADLNNVKVLPYALWYKEDVIPFQYMDSSGGVGMGSVVYQFPFWHPVRSITLDKLVEKIDISPKNINFVKMDIEGSEIRALEGMAEILKTVDAVSVAAYHKIDNSGAKSYKDVLSLLESKGLVTRLERGCDGEMVYANRQ
jgi:FkbM family methyltransferase